MAKAHVVQLTSVHHLFDNRIFEKECKSLVQDGFKVTLIGQHPRDEMVDGIQILGVAKPRNRAHRILTTSFTVFKRALGCRADVYHFHDPELIPWCIFLRLMGRKVIYDVHEDYVIGLATVAYLKGRGGWILGQIYGLFEMVAKHMFYVVVAERYYARRLTNSTYVLNYPRLDRFKDMIKIKRARPKGERIRLVYTGVLAFDRGALIYAKMAKALQGGEILSIGRMPADVAARMRAICSDDDKLRLDGVETHIPYDAIIATYKEPWTAALALFEDTLFSREKEITKFFEYMAAGIPVIASDFPVWKTLIEGEGVGICINPLDADAALEAAIWLRDHPDEARAMGERGRKAVMERYHWQSQADNLIGLYEQILSLPRTKRQDAGRLETGDHEASHHAS